MIFIIGIIRLDFFIQVLFPNSVLKSKIQRLGIEDLLLVTFVLKLISYGSHIKIFFPAFDQACRDKCRNSNKVESELNKEQYRDKSRSVYSAQTIKYEVKSQKWIYTIEACLESVFFWLPTLI